MRVPDSHPALLLHHDGELADLRQLLEELGARFREHRGAAGSSESPNAFDVVISTPRRILERRPGWDRSGCRMIAILDGDSRTLRTQLRRMGVDLIVRRPVHPAALRLLILHTLYRGPERRRLERVSVGAEVRFRRHLRSRPATLMDLSLNGARLLTRHAMERGGRLNLRLGADVTGGRPLRLSATVVRCGPAPLESKGGYVIALRFESPGPARADRLKRVVESHRSGPMSLREPFAGSPASRPVPSEPDGARPDLPAAFVFAAEQAEADPADADRRDGARHLYDRRVVALGDQATRVLLGRDISSGGMRVDPNPGLAVGHQLRLALHGMGRDEPLVVDARVARDDGETGLVLRFGEIDDDGARTLDRLMSQLAVLEADKADDDDESGVVISEILNRPTG